MKKLIGCIAMVTALLGMSSCQSFLREVGLLNVTVNDPSEFIEAMKKDCNTLTLNCDIDGGGEEWPGFGSEKFNGNGHVVRNFNNDGPLFNRADVENATFEDITIVSTGAKAAVVSYGLGDLTNVHVKDCTLEAKEELGKNDHGFLAGILSAGGNYTYSSIDGLHFEDSPTITNCSVTSSTLSIADPDFLTVGYDEAYIGLLAAQAESMQGCKVEDCTMVVDSNGVYSSIYIGGLVGIANGLVERCYAKNNEISYSSKFFNYQELTHSYFVPDENFIGGLAGSASNANISICYTEENKISIDSVGGFRAGGIVGTITSSSLSQCYDSNTEFVTEGIVHGAKARRLGQFCGTMGNATISSSFAYSSIGLADDGEGDKDMDSFVSGFAASSNDTSSIMQCAAYSSSVDGLRTDCFADEGPLITSCYMTCDNDTANINEIEAIDSSAWMGEGLILRLSLMDSAWKSGLFHPVLEL